MDAQAVKKHIVGWLKDYSTRSNTSGFVVGVSGGIDSAVTSTLCALTGKKTILMNMPIRQDPKEITRGTRHIKMLCDKHENVSSLTTELTSTYDEFAKALTENMDLSKNEEMRNLTLSNARSRIRMTTLYAVAGYHNLLVCGTGNKVEDFGVGFFTKYGDGGVDLSPIADLMKSEVYKLGKALGVAKEILNARPTDGLWDDGRTDEDQIGATYDELEWAMRQQMKYGDNPPVHTFNERENKVWKIYISRHKANLHKMKEIPICEIPDGLFD